MNATSPLPPDALLARAQPHAARAVRMARRALLDPDWIARARQRLRLLSAWLAWITPALLILVIVGSLVQNNSAMVETAWEITALAVLVAGVSIAIADSGYYYLKALDGDEEAELQDAAANSSLAAQWLASLEGRRTPCRFDLEIVWALVAADRSDSKA